MRLWDIDKSLARLLYDGTNHETGEISDEALAEIEALELDREKKLLAIAGYVKGERAEAEAVKKEADALASRAKGHSARADTLEQVITRTLAPGECIRDERSWLKWRRSSAVIVDDLDKLPIELIVYPDPPPPRADKSALRKALNDGAVDGARIEERQSLVIK